MWCPPRANEIYTIQCLRLQYTSSHENPICVNCRSQVYTIYSMLLIVFIILIIVTAFITVALTYFQLAVEDHRWWWRSVMCGGSTGRLRGHAAQP